MRRHGLFASILVGSALLAGSPAQAAQNFGAISNIVNSLHNGSSLSGNGFAFTVQQNGQSQTLFSGIGGVRQFNSAGMPGLNAWANPSASGSGGYSYTPTFTGVGGFFGSGGGNTGQSYNYAPTFTGVGSFFGSGSGGSTTPQSYPYTPTFSTAGSYFSGGSQGYNYTPTYTAVDGFFRSGNAAPQNTNIETPVPEPASWATMIIGFFAVGGAMRRRKGAPNLA